MKIYAFEVRDDEVAYFKQLEKQLSLKITLTNELLTKQTLNLVSDYDAITILGQSQLDQEMLLKLQQHNIKYIATRTIGYNHIDIKTANQLGIKVCNANYPPTGVADYTIMLILLVIRNYKPALWRGQVYDYSLTGLCGREMDDLTIGIIGTGRIGATVIKKLSGFGCKILAYDNYTNPEVTKYATYCDLETIYQKCDVISLHVPLLDSTYHLINKDSIAKMKDGVILINCARGELMKIDDLIDAIENRKIGGLGLDTVETEEGLIHIDHRNDILNNRGIHYLRQFPNVVMTQHMAFYTDKAVKSMVVNAIEGIVLMATNGTYKTMITEK